MENDHKSILVYVVGIGVPVVLLLVGSVVSSAVDCPTVTSLISACTSFITFGAPDPYPESPCCMAIGSIKSLADSVDDVRSICRCVMGLTTAYNPNASVIASLPGLCGVSLGFTIDPTTDCN